MENPESVQQAIRDLSIIRQAIENAKNNGQSPKAQIAALKANVILQTISLCFALIIVAGELLTNHSTTQFMMLSTHAKEIGVLGLIQVGLALPVFVMCLYFIVWRSSRHSEQGFSTFVANHFQYLRRLSFITDLLIKFVVLSLLILASHPEWIGPVLVLFTADYLFQGRFFSLPINLSLALGLICLVAAAVLFLQQSCLLIWPLALFALINTISLLVGIRMLAKASPQEKV